MNGNIVGEEFDEFVADQIKIRQSNQFGGYDSSRTNDQLQYLNNRNAWIKLASSVDILEGNIIKPVTQVDGSGQTIVTTLNGSPSKNKLNLGLGALNTTGTLSNILSNQVVNVKSDKLRKIEIENPEQYPGSKLAEKAVLFNTLSSFDPTGKSYSTPRANISNNKNLWNDNFTYGIGGTNFGIQPPPGIIGATVDSLNRGSIRKANVTLKAHNKFQFDVIELLYLRLGFTMMLEWGWDKYLDNNTGKIEQIGNTIIEEEWFTSKGVSQIEMLGYIQDKRDKYDGNYDGFFGKVSNFTWNFNPDGSYDISIDLITVGDVIESLKVNTFSKASFSTNASINEIDPTLKLENTNISKAFTLSSVGYFLYKKIEEFSKTIPLSSPSSVKKEFARYRDPINNSTVYARLVPSEGSVNKQYYIRLDEFLSQLENLVVPVIQNNTESSTPQISISYTLQENLISYFPNQIPLDPKVCIFKPSLNSYNDIKGITPPEYLNYLDDFLLTESGKTYGLLMNLYINFEFIAGLLVANGGPDQELSLFKFLQDLCNGINSALGGVNKLEPIIKNDYIVTIIDQTLSSNDPTSVSLEVYGYNPSNSNNQVSNFVKDIKFVSKITPQLASMVSIGATAAGSSTSEIDGTAFSKWSEGLVDRFTQEILEPNNLSTLNEGVVEDLNKYKKEFEKFPPKDNIVSRTFMRIFETGRWGRLKRQGEFEKDIRKITDPYYSSIHNTFMTFEKFYSSALEIRKNKEKAGYYKSDEIKNLVNKNYAVYLANAFGGEVEEIKIEKITFVKTGQTIVGGAKVYKQELVATPLKLTNPRYLEFNDTFISQGKAAYQNYIKTLNNTIYTTQNTPSSEIGFIPLSFDLVLDGISGIKIYNKLNINNKFLPSNYPESLNFIITKVNHNISNNNWETSLSTISMPKTEPYRIKSFPSAVNTEQINSTGPIGPQPDNGAPFLILDGRNNRNVMTLDALLSELDPIAQPSFRKFFDILKDKYSGYKVIVNDVRRTWEESYNLKIANPLNADPGRSQHNYGLAIDINIETPASTTKRTLLKRQKAPWIEEGIDKVAIDAGLRWGGNFINYIDCVHFDFDFNLNTAYNQVITQAENLDRTLRPPFSSAANGLEKVKKIDKLIKEGKIKLQ
jgi:hypothetical protein